MGKCSACGKDTEVVMFGNTKTRKVANVCEECSKKLKMKASTFIEKYGKKPKKPVYLALDAHDIPRYIRKIRKFRPRIKKCDDIDYIVGTKANRGTHYCHKILSIDIVEDEKFTLGFVPIFNAKQLPDSSISLIENIKPKVSIKAVLMDREFFNGYLITQFQKLDIPYIIRAVKTKFVKNIISFVEKNHLPFFVKEYVLNTNTHKKGRVPVKTNLVIVDNAILENTDKTLYDDGDRFFAFVTNIDVNTMDDAFELARDFR